MPARRTSRGLSLLLIALLRFAALRRRLILLVTLLLALLSTFLILRVGRCLPERDSGADGDANRGSP